MMNARTVLRHSFFGLDSDFWFRPFEFSHELAAGEPGQTHARSMTTMAKANKQYEAMFLFGVAAAPEAEKAIQTARGILERHGGSVLVAKRWDERKLAYEIHGQKRGLYVITYFTAPGDAIGAIERDVNLSEEVLRVMITDAAHLNTDEMNAVEPQPIIKEESPSWARGGARFERGGDRGDRRDRDDRGDRGGDRGGDRDRGGVGEPE